MATPHPSTTHPSPYPYAAAPDIIRAHQKDAYFSGVLTSTLADLHRRLLGARSAHAWTTEQRTAADLLYLSLTTLVGNRTLGEEYCDLVQVSADPGANNPVLLPSLPRRAAYIATTILLPYAAARILPRLRATLRSLLESRLATLKRKTNPRQTKDPSAAPTPEYRLLRYALAHLPALTSPGPLHALALATFYFTGAYYTLSKRLLRLRYVFTTTATASTAPEHRAGYEVLGVLLVAQLAVRGWLHARETLAAGVLSGSGSAEEAAVEAAVRERVRRTAGEVSLSHENSYAANNDLLLSGLDGPGGSGGGGAGEGAAAAASRLAVGLATHTAVLPGARYDLKQGAAMRWIKGAQQRRCTLCLEEMRDPAAPQCGHVFCWTCIGDWVREKPECPLCRREAMAQHILPLRAI